MRVVLVGLASLVCECHGRRQPTISEHAKGVAHEEDEVLAIDAHFLLGAASSHLNLQALTAFLLAERSFPLRDHRNGEKLLSPNRAIGVRQSSPSMRSQSLRLSENGRLRQVEQSASRSASASLCEEGHLPKVLFVLGGPGAGKGTQCEKVVEQCSSWAHISAGDCLREERADPTSKEGEMINSYIKEGRLVPSSVVVKLLQKAMAAKMQEGKTCVLIDGFPRSEENMQTWYTEVGDAADVKGVLFFDVDEEEMEKRLIKRGETSGRADDNIETIRKRFVTYKEETLPVLECFKAEGKIFCVDSGRDVDAVWESTHAIIQFVEEFK